MRGGCSDYLRHLGETTDYEEGRIDFAEIMELFKGQVVQELGPPFYDEDDILTAEEMLEAADLALEIYEEVETEDEAIKEMLASDNECLAWIGQALDSYDWASLAI